MDLARLLLDQALNSERDGNAAAAEMFYRGLLAEQPGHAEAAFRLGMLLCRCGKAEEGLEWLAAATHSAPMAIEPALALGQAQQATGRAEDAAKTLMIAACLQAVQLTPADAQAHFSLGLAFNRAERDADAAQAYGKAIALRPDFSEAHNNLGVTLHNLLALDAAVTAHRQAVALAPGRAAFHCNLAHALLASGALEEGFREWEWRAPSPPRNFAQPRWDGTPYPGKVLLAHAEQGYGDTLQFARFLPQVAALGGRVVVECRRPLLTLLARLPGVGQTVAWGDPLPPFDLQVPIPSLAHLCGTTAHTVPAAVPYLQPDPQRVEAWHQRIDGLGGFKLGLVWAGNPKGADSKRALPPALLAGLAGIPGLTLVSLQKSDGAGLPAELAASGLITDFGHLIDDFDDLAAALHVVDLLLSVDTAAAHLAGALGRRVWTLLHASPDWRWLADDASTPWYPTMRLYRQCRPGDWAEVIDRIARDLSESCS